MISGSSSSSNASEYLAGRTPNPRACNRLVKSGCSSRSSLNPGGVDAFATGHYARLSFDKSQPVAVRKAADPAKGPAYFLCFWQEQLARAIFSARDLAKASARRAKDGRPGDHDGPRARTSRRAATGR